MSIDTILTVSTICTRMYAKDEILVSLCVQMYKTAESNIIV